MVQWGKNHGTSTYCINDATEWLSKAYTMVFPMVKCPNSTVLFWIYEGVSLQWGDILASGHKSDVSWVCGWCWMTPTVYVLSVADVLQVAARVLSAQLRFGPVRLQPRVRVPPELRAGRHAAWCAVPHESRCAQINKQPRIDGAPPQMMGVTAADDGMKHGHCDLRDHSRAKRSCKDISVLQSRLSSLNQHVIHAGCSRGGLCVRMRRYRWVIPFSPVAVTLYRSAVSVSPCPRSHTHIHTQRAHGTASGSAPDVTQNDTFCICLQEIVNTILIHFLCNVCLFLLVALKYVNLVTHSSTDEIYFCLCCYSFTY